MEARRKSWVFGRGNPGQWGWGWGKEDAGTESWTLHNELQRGCGEWPSRGHFPSLWTNAIENPCLGTCQRTQWLVFLALFHVLSPIGQCLLNSELLAAAQEGRCKALWCGFSVELGSGRRTSEIRSFCTILPGGNVWACPEEIVCGHDRGEGRRLGPRI